MVIMTDVQAVFAKYLLGVCEIQCCVPTPTTVTH